MRLGPPPAGDDWIGLSDHRLPVDDVAGFVERPDCGATVVFTGLVRDHSDGRPAVSSLEYEAYEEEVAPRLAAIAAEARNRWPVIGRLVVLHRSGKLAVGEASVVVAASCPHRDEAFAAARFCIDTVKASVPIWKRETWDGGDDWSACAHPVTPVGGP